MLDFEAIKRIPIVEVAAGHYKLPFRFRGGYANAPCPLPTHKQGDKAKSFSINLAGNYWRCFSDSCNASNGGKRGGDVINFVAAMEKSREKEAAEKLASWFGVGKEKAASRMEARPVSTDRHQKTYPDPSTGSDSVKYMQEIDAWFDALFKRGEKETDLEYWKRCRNGVKTKLVDSFRNGKKSLAA
jgi:DNA primase